MGRETPYRPAPPLLIAGVCASAVIPFLPIALAIPALVFVGVT